MALEGAGRREPRVQCLPHVVFSRLQGGRKGGVPVPEAERPAGDQSAPCLRVALQHGGSDPSPEFRLGSTRGEQPQREEVWCIIIEPIWSDIHSPNTPKANSISLFHE